MALKVWLPLDGDLRNLGCSDVEVTNNGTTVDNSGKIGKCYYFNGTSSNYMTTTYSTAIGTNNFSIAMWIKIPTLTSGSYYAICTSKTTAAASAGFGIYWNYSQKKFLWSTADGSGATEIWMANTVDTIIYDKWIHLVMVRNNSDSKKGYFYINGTRYELASIPVIRNITTDTKMNLGRCTNNAYFAKMYLNDFRIYNHALSAAEVHEIAMGLVLHYKLDSLNNNNLFKYNGLNNYNEEFQLNNYNNTGSFTQFGNCLTIDPANYLNQKFTISFDAISPNGTTSLLLYNANGNPRYFYYSTTLTSNLSTEWQHFSYTFTNTDRGSNYSVGYHPLEIYMPNKMGGKVRNIKVEFGEVATPWISSNLILDNIIKDSSGYGHNGTIINAPTISSDTSKYSSSINFNGTTDGILIENLNISNIINTAVTYSFWIKPNGENGVRSVYFGSYSGTSWSIEKTSGNVLRSYWSGSPDETCSNATITDGVWQHICIVKDGTNSIKVYINGVQKWASTATHSNLTFPTTFRIGRDSRSNDGTPYKGQMSDFRIYCTPLLDNDIKMLYNVSMKIDNLGEIHTFEFKEDENENEKLLKTGILKTNEIEETTTQTAKLEKNKGWLSPNFIEI